MDSIGNMTFQSALPDLQATDRYTNDQRRQILKGINPKPNPTYADLYLMDKDGLPAKIRQLAYRDGPEAIQEVRKFTRPLMHAILRVQYKIVVLEEENSWGKADGMRHAVLENLLVTYCALLYLYLCCNH